jgi:hypothetical protein
MSKKDNSTMTKQQALELAKWWRDLHQEAEAEESVGNHGMAERLRMDALNEEQKLRKAGYAAQELLREIERAKLTRP